MRPFERRAADAYPYFRLAMEDTRTLCLRQLPGVFETEDAARLAATKPGQYAIGRIDENGRRTEGERFEVTQ